MECPIVIIRGGTPIAQSLDWDADIAYGSDENRATIKRIGMTLQPGDMWQCDGTQLAGIVDTVCPSADEDGSSSVQYKGRTCHGVLASRIIVPPSGQSNLVVSGDLNACIETVISSLGLGGYFIVSGNSGITATSYSFYRYINAYDGLRMLCQQYGARLDFNATADGIEVSAVSADVYGDIPSELVAFSAERTYRPTNHMIGLGSGEGAARNVVDWYADSSGNLSQTQTLFGVDEVADTYDFASSDDLSADTKNKLADLQGQGSVTVDLPAETNLDVGDIVTASESTTGISVKAEVVKVVATISNGMFSASYETGTPEWPESED